jgi:hypothetical protein
MTSQYDELLSDFRTVAGDSILGVGIYDGGDYEVLHIRGDFAERYSEDRLDEIARDMYLEGVTVEYQEQMLYDLGDLGATIRLFEGGTSINVPLAENAGIGIGLDAESDLSTVQRLVDRCVGFRAHWAGRAVSAGGPEQ